MTFNEACVLMQSGNKIKRHIWPKYKFLTVLPPEITRIDDVMVYTFTAKGQYKPWFPYDEDITKNDWKVYNDEIPLMQKRLWQIDKNLIDRIQKANHLFKFVK